MMSIAFYEPIHVYRIKTQDFRNTKKEKEYCKFMIYTGYLIQIE